MFVLEANVPSEELRIQCMADIWAPLVTTAGALTGSFGGYLLAARAQRRAEDRKDDRDRKVSALNRSLVLEDERHEFQLRTLLSLQELLRGLARSTYLVIEQDRKTIEEHGGFRQLPEDLDAEGFGVSIDFYQSAARVTDDALEDFNRFCTKAQLPPDDHRTITRDTALQLQELRYRDLSKRFDVVAKLLGERLRTEVDRNKV